MGDRLPDLLTVEEAMVVLRVGRTKAYAMTREWRTTGGRSGLPCVDLGHSLRVPRCQLEAMVGGPLAIDASAAPAPAFEVIDPPDAPAGVEPVRPPVVPRPKRHRRVAGLAQPPLPFED